MNTVSITPTEVIEYLFCPRFIYFMECLKIPQHENLRYKVLMGREVHERKAKVNREYVRKKIGCVDKEISVYLSSPKYKIRGIVDEVLSLADDTMAPLEYKFAEYRPYVFKTHRTQLALEALLIQENYGKPVKRGFLVYVRSKNFLREVLFKQSDYENASKIVEEILRIVQNGYYPKKTKSKVKCVDCCYKNICV